MLPRQPLAAGSEREGRPVAPGAWPPSLGTPCFVLQAPVRVFLPHLRACHVGIHHRPLLACCWRAMPGDGLQVGDAPGFGRAGLGCHSEAGRGRIRAQIAGPAGQPPGGAERGEADSAALRACATSPPLRACTARLAVRRGGQVVRRRSRKPKIAGSNPVRAWGGSGPSCQVLLSILYVANFSFWSLLGRPLIPPPQ